MTLEELLTCATWRAYLHALDAHLVHERFNHDGPVEPVMVDIQEEWMDHANVSADALLALIDAERTQTFHYIGQKLAAYSEADGGADNIVTEPANLHMPVGHLIEYYLHQADPAGVISYLKKIRMPGARAYAVKTAAMFDVARQAKG